MIRTEPELPDEKTSQARKRSSLSVSLFLALDDGSDCEVSEESSRKATTSCLSNV